MDKLDNRVDFVSTPFVFLGDYVDGYPDTAKVVERLRQYDEQYPHWTFLMGNHEDMLLEVVDMGPQSYWFDTWWYHGGYKTMCSYNANTQAGWLALPPDAIRRKPFVDDVQWFRNLTLFVETSQYIFVHAGLTPGRMPQQLTPRELLWIRREFINSSFDWGKTVIYGHTPSFDPDVQPNKIGINTLNRAGGYLTAVILDADNQFAKPEFVTSIDATL